MKKHISKVCALGCRRHNRNFGLVTTEDYINLISQLYLLNRPFADVLYFLFLNRGILRTSDFVGTSGDLVRLLFTVVIVLHDL